MLRQFIVRCIANGLGLWIAGDLIPGISYSDSFAVLVIAALIFSVVNALIRPIAVLLALPAIILTLGLFTLIINGLMLYLVTLLYNEFTVASFGSAIIAVIIIWIVNYAINTVVPKK